jgi:hypothetical protein
VNGSLDNGDGGIKPKGWSARKSNNWNARLVAKKPNPVNISE